MGDFLSVTYLAQSSYLTFFDKPKSNSEHLFLERVCNIIRLCTVSHLIVFFITCLFNPCNHSFLKNFILLFFYYKS